MMSRSLGQAMAYCLGADHPNLWVHEFLKEI